MYTLGREFIDVVKRLKHADFLPQGISQEIGVSRMLIDFVFDVRRATNCIIVSRDDFEAFQRYETDKKE